MSPPFVAALLAVAVAFSMSTKALALTSRNKNMNKHEAKFERMIDALELPPATVEFIDSPKQRVLFRGVSAGVQEPAIRNAFSIIYKDLAPVRVAGDIIFAQLSSVAAEASERASGVRVATVPRDDTIDTDMDTDYMDATTLATWRQFFDLFDGDNSGGIDRTELVASPELLAIIYDNDADDANDDDNADAAVDRFMKLADENGDGVISFAEFAYAAATQPRLQLVEDANTLAVALQSSSSSASSVVSGLGDEKKQLRKRGVFGRKSPEERFEGMIQECIEWEKDFGCAPADDYDNNGNAAAESIDEDGCVVDVKIEQRDDGQDGRLLQVLKGSLVGVRCEPVVEALKMCYLEYSALRLGGDVIFKLLKNIVASQIPNQK